MGRWRPWIAALLIIWAYSCGSGSDEIFITCNNAGSGQQVCAATGGANVDVPPDERTPTPRR